MKPILLYILIFQIAGCGLTTNNGTENFIAGTYTRQSQTEFGKIYDTVVISTQNSNAHQYKIEKRWRYDRMLDGRPDPEYKREETTGLYDRKSTLMQDQRSGENYSFDPERKLLFIGTNQYNKQN